MKKFVIMGALLVAPTLTFAGGAGSMAYSDMADRAGSSNFGSSEDPNNILNSREAIGSENDNYVRYSFSFIPQSYWETQTGINLSDPNGFIELEEYFGETERQTYSWGEDIDREAERQERAKNKALRLRSIYR